MRFDKFIPAEPLKPYIKYYVLSENGVESEYKVFPSSGLVIIREQGKRRVQTMFSKWGK